MTVLAATAIEYEDTTGRTQFWQPFLLLSEKPTSTEYWWAIKSRLFEAPKEIKLGTRLHLIQQLFKKQAEAVETPDLALRPVDIHESQLSTIFPPADGEDGWGPDMRLGVIEGGAGRSVRNRLAERDAAKPTDALTPIGENFDWSAFGDEPPPPAKPKPTFVGITDLADRRLPPTRTSAAADPEPAALATRRRRMPTNASRAAGRRAQNNAGPLWRRIAIGACTLVAATFFGAGNSGYSSATAPTGASNLFATNAASLTAPRPHELRLAAGQQGLFSMYDGADAQIDAVLNGARARSDFGLRTHPRSGIRNTFHDGWDMAAPVGTPLTAPASGCVRYYYQNGMQSFPINSREDLANMPAKGRLDGYGIYAVLEFDGPMDGFAMRVAHLDRFPADLLTGDRCVRQGQVFAYSGDTGGSTGPHVHGETLIALDDDEASRWSRLLRVDERTYAPFDPAMIHDAVVERGGQRIIDAEQLRTNVTASLDSSMDGRERSRIAVQRRPAPVAAAVDAPVPLIEDGATEDETLETLMPETPETQGDLIAGMYQPFADFPPADSGLLGRGDAIAAEYRMGAPLQLSAIQPERPADGQLLIAASTPAAVLPLE